MTSRCLVPICPIEASGINHYISYSHGMLPRRAIAESTRLIIAGPCGAASSPAGGCVLLLCLGTSVC
jgi:hypothetical protein